MSAAKRKRIAQKGAAAKHAKEQEQRNDVGQLEHRGEPGLLPQHREEPDALDIDREP